MDINATMYGELIIVFAIIISSLSYYLARNKTKSPVKYAITGFISSLIPPLGLIFIFVLSFKSELPKEKVAQS